MYVRMCEEPYEGFVRVSCHMDTSNYRSSPNDRLL